jgi:hypothetical protein
MNHAGRETRIGRRILDQQRLRMQDHVLACRGHNRPLVLVEPHAGLEPHPLRVQKSDVGVRRVIDPRRQRGNLRKRRIGSRVQHLVMQQSLQPLRLIAL